jgi:hypothetical protein
VNIGSIPPLCTPEQTPTVVLDYYILFQTPTNGTPCTRKMLLSHQ